MKSKIQLFYLGKYTKIKKWSRDHLTLDTPPQRKVVPLLCFVYIFIEKPNNKVVPLVIFADPPAP